MARVILHIGDKVTHSTLGEGVVTIVDDEFVTIKFATDELTFRLSDAFDNGFLSSQDAEFVEEDEDEDDEEEEVEYDEDEGGEEDDPDDEDEFEAVSSSTIANNKPDSSRLIGAILVGVVFIPIGIALIWASIALDFPILSIIGIVFGIVCLASPFMAYFIRDSKTGGAPYRQSSPSAPVYSVVFPPKKKDTGISESERIRRDIYKMQDEELGILEDMQSMHKENPDADLEEHFGWEHKLEYDAEDVEHSW